MGLRLFVAVACAGLVLGACGGDDERGIGAQDTGATGDTTVADVSQDTTSADTSGPQLGPNACTEAVGCGGVEVCRSNVCVADPPTGSESTLTDPHDNLATSDLPDLSCLEQTMDPPAQTMTATLYGAVVRFGSGRKTFDMVVEVLAADGFDPSACEAEATVEARTACYRGYGTVIGTTTSVAAPTPTLPASCEGHEECPLGYQCTEKSSVVHECTEQFGLYEIADVPLDTPLVIRSYATKNEHLWHDTYVFNVILFSDQVSADGRAQYDATMVSEGQWILTTNTVQLPEISEDNGAVGGRVRDCRGVARDSWPISEVSIDLEDPARRVVFFNDLEDDTVPLDQRESTNLLGRFAALDIPAGWNRIAGSARIAGQVVSIGSAPVYIFPDGLTIVSWPGRQPFWRQH